MPYANPQYLVETDWLAEHLQDPSLRILEVTGVKHGPDNTARQSCYEKRHIPGASEPGSYPSAIFTQQRAFNLSRACCCR